MRSLYKTTIVVWSEYNTDGMEIEDIARQATYGDSYCSSQECEQVEDPSLDPDWDMTEFFDDDDDWLDAEVWEN